MREYKFRQLVNGRWHYFGFIDGAFIGPVSPDIENNPVNQFTGLRDKNGREIYEADIIRSIGFNVHMRDRYPTGPEPVEHKFEYIKEVSMDNPYWPVLYIGDSEPDIEVLGNVYEHPRLLETTP